ncbi:hypothetical protein [Nitrosomonas sp.]|uniref:hypothetical protein n=1 Tax=Nitrosomonas sp. TaxID=42353 RepID=UPI001D1F299A|nr:hypothetical protein [Nitrosomonas sp.]MCB1949856.1 hypothetical protein [Nitrosomonas sp.]
MARRKAGLIGDILTITSALPWWIGVILAATAYVVLHHYASLDMPKTNIGGCSKFCVSLQIT